MKGLIAEVALDGATFAFDKLYTYAIPCELHKKAVAGCRVTVPFGRGNTKKQGIIFSIKEAELKGLKNILSVMDEKPVLSDEMLILCKYLKESVFCTYYDGVHTMLPAGLNYRMVNYYSANTEFSVSLLDETEREVFDYLSRNGEKAENVILSDLGILKEVLDILCEKEAVIKNSTAKRKMGDATQKWVRIRDGVELDNIKLTPRQREVAELVNAAGATSVKEICYFTGASVSVIESLIKKEVLISFEKQVFRAPKREKTTPDTSDIHLTEEQNAAYEGLYKDYRSQDGKTALLYGVTGSGKTQVFLKLADSVIDDNKGVIVMVPEISLTPQLISIFTSRYGNKVAVFHSAMSMGQRMDEWQRIREGKAVIAVGTRSAVFAPFRDLGLIIIDEEQEHTYKSEKTPRYHTRDVARFRTAYHKGLLCLASATPSVESFTLAKKGKYSLYKLESRYGNAVLPHVETVDMKKEILSGNSGVLSTKLYEAVKDALEQGHQAIILLNRRGHNTYISCPNCGHVATCPNCSVSLTYHSANKRLMCHYCGYSESANGKCSECGSEHMKFLGLGTQKAEEEIAKLFPTARVLRLDADSTVSRDSYSTYLSAFSKGEYNILLGTQMVAKGLDFPNVTVVGVLGADSAMYSEDYRSFERTFSLLTQVVGRAGRGENEGVAIVQTVDPQSSIINLAKNQDFDSFYEEEILTRKLMIYPPYCDICVVGVKSQSRDTAENTLKQIFVEIKRLITEEYSDIKLIILGPAPYSVPKINNKYRFRIIIKCKNSPRFRELLRKAMSVKLTADTTVSVDFNPESIV